MPISQLYNISSVIILFVGLLVLFQVCKPFDWKRWTIWGSMAAASLLCIMPAGSLFGTQPLTLQSFLIMIVFLLLAQPCIHAAFWLFQEGRTLLSKMQENEWEQN